LDISFSPYWSIGWTTRFDNSPFLHHRHALHVGFQYNCPQGQFKRFGEELIRDSAHFSGSDTSLDIFLKKAA
jgi:hypothetical protein